MRDIRLMIYDKEAATQEARLTGQDPVWWTFDVAIADGEFIFVPTEDNNMDQRAAISAFTVIGSIYGDKDYGIDWSPYFAKETGLVNVDNQIKKNIQNNAMPNFEDGVASMYGIQYIPNKDKMSLRIVKGDNDVRT